MGLLGALGGFFGAALLHPAILSGAKPNVIDALIAQLGLEVPLVAALLFGLPRVTGFSLRQLGFAVPRAREIGIACVATLCAIIVVSIVSQILENAFHLKHEQAIIQQFEALREPSRIAFFAFFAIVLGPIAEETIFRVFLFNVGLRYGGFWFGAIFSAALFGLAHLNVIDAIPLACVGLILAGVYYITRNAYASMLTHALFNAFSVVGLLLSPHILKG